MNNHEAADSHRQELLARCRRERNELALMTSTAASRLHARDLLRAVRLLRRLLRLLDAK